MAKTPSPKVIASMWVLQKLNIEHTAFSKETLTALANSRVGDAKIEKVKDQIGKITLKLQERLQKVVDKFNGVTEKPKPAAKKKAGTVATKPPATTKKVAAVAKKAKKTVSIDDDDDD